MWQQSPPEDVEPDAWRPSKQPIPRERSSRQSDWSPLPPLPKWPPLPEEDPLAPERLSADSSFEPYEAQQTDRLAQQHWEEPVSSQYGRYKLPFSTFWQRFRSASRQKRVLLATGACGLLLLLLIGTTVLAVALRSHVPVAGLDVPPGGSAQGTALASTTAHSTPSITTTPTTNTPSPPLTLVFTCSSGTVGGTGQVCVHTLPNASLTLSVRYCDGNLAKGKGFHGATYADNNGNFTWRWDISTSCVGSATATVAARSSGQTVTQSVTFTVSR
jgi:hypothetical protein